MTTRTTILFTLSVAAAWAQSPPDGFSVVSATSSSVQLRWAKVDGAQSYIVERAAEGADFASLANVKEPAATDKSIDAMTAYRYRVRTSTPDGQGAPSNEVIVGPPPRGYQTAVGVPGKLVDDQVNDFGLQLDMVLDRSGDPAFTYLYLDDTSDDGVSGDTGLYFFRWDRAHYRWTTPVKVTNPGDISRTGADTETSLAYDATTDAFAVAYMVKHPDAYEIDIAVSKDGGATWAVSPVINTDAQRVDEPRIALNGGNLYMSYWKDYSPVQYVNGKLDDPTTWMTRSVPQPDNSTPRTTTVRVDPNGNPVIAWWAYGDSYNSELLYWSPSMDVATKAGDTNGIQNDAIGVSLAFDGANPRIAAFANLDWNLTAMWLFRSNDGGNTWMSPVNIPDDVGVGAGKLVQLAIGAHGEGAVVSQRASGSGADLCGEPKLSRSSDLMSWSTCNPQPLSGDLPGFHAWYPRIAYTNGNKLYIAFDDPYIPDFPAGIIFWREP